MSGKAVLGQQWCDGVDVSLLVTVGVALGIRRTCCDAPSIVVCHVGYKPTHGSRASCRLVQGPKQLCCRFNVGRPAEPPFQNQSPGHGRIRTCSTGLTCVTSIEVHDDVLHVQSFNCICSKCLISICSISTFLDVSVCDQVGETVGLWSRQRCDASTSIASLPMTSKKVTSGNDLICAAIMSMYS